MAGGMVMDYQDVLELEAPHGFLMAQEKKTAIAQTEPLETDKSYLIVSDGEAFGIAAFEEPAQVKTKQFDAEEWQSQHRITQRERRQWWPDSEAFYVYRLKEWRPFEGIKLFEDGEVIDEPRLTAEQWQIVSTAKLLPKQIILDNNFVILTDDKDIICPDEGIYINEVRDVVNAAFNEEIKSIPSCNADDKNVIPLYSLALVRNPRMRVSKKSQEDIREAIKQEEGEDMPFAIRRQEDEYCVVKINPDESEEVMACHETEEEAEAQLTALRINVEAEEGEGGSDKPKKPKPRKKEMFGREQSIDQQLNFIRRQFEDEFNSKTDNAVPAESYVWVNDIFDSFVIVDEEGKLFRVDYMMFEDEIIFSPRERWVEVERGYRPKGFKQLASNLSPRKKTIGSIDTGPNFIQRLKLAAKNILDIVTLAEIEQKEAKAELLNSNYGVAQKEVNGELWHFTWSTNAFEDREGEIFSTKSLENYVLQAEKNADRGHFNLWHINAEDGNFNTDFARKEWQGVVGRFLVEAGPYLDDIKGQAAKKFFSKYSNGHPEIAPEGWGCSPEFRYLPEERATGIYKNIWITRTSTLPKFAAANVWTDTRQLTRSKNMALSDDQYKAAVEIFQDENFVKNLIAEGENKTAELEADGVAHKSQSEEVEQPESQAINMEELAAEVGKQFTANFAPAFEAMKAEIMEAVATEVKELKEWKDKQDKAQGIKDKTETPRFVYELKRASENEETVVTDDDGLKDKKPTETKAGASDPWSQLFNK